MKTIRTVVTLMVGALALGGCFIIDDLVTYELEVINRCTGGNYTVAFYFDGTYQRDITTSHTFVGISPGPHLLEAYGSTYFRREANFNSDATWTLCPYYGLQGAAEAADDVLREGVESIDPAEVKP